MPKEKSQKGFRLPSVDDLFSSAEERETEKLTSGRIMDVPISEIDDFPEHPFHVEDNAEMDALMESIKEHGVIEPATVRKKDDGRYEMISGHRRKHASTRLGLSTIRCEVVEIGRDEAIQQMVESNLHREHILPSEKAFAYKMRLEAISRQRKDLDNDTLVGIESAELVGKECGDGKTQVRRYIRLTYLIPELLEMVDNSVLKNKGMKQIALRPAVELSYLTETEQKILLGVINDMDCTPSHAQAIILRKASQDEDLSVEDITDVLCVEKANQTVKQHLSEKLVNMLPPKIRDNNVQINEYLEKAVAYYEKMQARRKDKETDFERPL